MQIASNNIEPEEEKAPQTEESQAITHSDEINSNIDAIANLTLENAIKLLESLYIKESINKKAALALTTIKSMLLLN